MPTISFSGDINGAESDGVGRAEKREWHLCQTPVFGSLQAELEALVLVTGLVRSETQCSDGIANADRGRFVAAATKRVSVTISDSPVTARGRKRAKRAKKYEAEKRPHIFFAKRARLPSVVLVTGLEPVRVLPEGF